MKIYNGVAHPVNIINEADVEYNPNIRKYIIKETKENDYEVVVTIPQNGEMLSATIITKTSSLLNRIPIRKKTNIIANALPDGYDIYIVSLLYAVTCMQYLDEIDISKIYTIMDPVYNKDGRLIGCLGIGPVFPSLAINKNAL